MGAIGLLLKIHLIELLNGDPGFLRLNQDILPIRLHIVHASTSRRHEQLRDGFVGRRLQLVDSESCCTWLVDDSLDRGLWSPVSSRIRSRDSPCAWPHNTSLTMVMSLDIVFSKMPASPMLRAFLAYQPSCHKLRRSCRFKRLAPVFGKTQPFQASRSKEREVPV